MSWSLTCSAPKAEARAAFVEEHRSQPAYKTDGSHKAVMDAIANYGGEVADAAPEGMMVTIQSYGHIGSDGVGSATVHLSVFKPPSA